MSKAQPIRKKPGQRPLRRRRLGWPARLILAGAAVGAILLGCAAGARLLAPTGNTSLGSFDAIIVLGAWVDADGNPTPTQLARVTEGVHEYERGVAPRLILTGGPTHHGYVEARVMARTAEAEGIPKSAIFMEPDAMDTIQNACYSARMMRQHGWRSAEVITSAYHLPRTGILFSRLPVEWRLHAAPSLEPQSAAYQEAAAFVEDLKTVRYFIWTHWTEPCHLRWGQLPSAGPR